MHIHILGICGTFMGGIAKLAIESGHRVSGSDQNVYPPMSTQLHELGIKLIEGYDPEQLACQPDLVLIGNALSRGNPCVEAVLNQGIAYTSGPQWLHDHILGGRWVLAVAGTHGKTTTASILAWILQANGLEPGFLIGGVAPNFAQTARLGNTPFFVVEADEYDSAFFDKRSKFVHYSPRTAILNNLEYDHADIFPDLAAIERQFHHLVRIIAGNGQIIAPGDSQALNRVLAMGCWSELVRTGIDSDWQIEKCVDDWQQFQVIFQGQLQAKVHWQLIGIHNARNALMAIIAARHVGIRPADAIACLSDFIPPKRRLEKLAELNGVTIYDDFAHHPSAIETTLQAMRANLGADTPIIAVLEPRSNTMKLGVHQKSLLSSLKEADQKIIYSGDAHWDVAGLFANDKSARCYSDIELVVADLLAHRQDGQHIVLMSNGGFAGLREKLLSALQTDK
ncbi:UDP-N-acetylmuramate:L-alanyl-gamma-D-glutamyl-meso-diaminopimelate ligase [Celerinatantimonas diazotrophica]|uniref:UDP-N-acetylmuramate--L-alanyl-gamma-D-glutamyl-meso-2,6-diaminoheptandioate ligase n=1 Tax=Celerinatantimonas diazotrophica TaxID=412034 RepID=A0A4R1J932_9GAMM|nr:UDP-N-acetylmuramate:L-alanyl-gamma-D-glutamyl-meso-diaminopimelate ligase [Celerinatantimonas diazotrophica]TCK46897.1 UDP-N-acetylmuramate: L-alanyl-gamma-D-glutamyl-meso-diaminopimelate ligase [Celerinatantimonas diazotrophica]CAG9295664.1 UDP-N-acetylmuramate--L-alanyl-gamma-D-glutamyl-meso-2,6-diaminoheptandioate ligase [Celerinatantimonas diazotrophica]